MVQEHCTTTDESGNRILDSHNVRDNALALRWLADKGYCDIEDDSGNKVLGCWRAANPYDAPAT